MVFEQLIISSLLYTPAYAHKVFSHLKADWFEDAGTRAIFSLVQEFHGKYNAFPNKESLAIDLSNSNLQEKVFNSAMNSLETLEREEVHCEWLSNETEKWARERALFLAMSESLVLIESGSKGDERDRIPHIIQEALGIKFDHDIGHDWVLNAEDQYAYYQNPVNKVPYLLECMNRATHGGNTRKSLSVVQAGIGVGKTTFLLNVAAGYAKQGLNVYYFSGEIAEEVLRERMDVSMFQMTSEQLRLLELHPYLNRVNQAKTKGFGKVLFKQFKAGATDANHFRKYIREAEAKFQIKFDVYLFDYIELVKSAILPAKMRSDSDLYFTSVAEELRNLAVEDESINWTAQQFTRSGQDELNPKISDSGRSIGVQKTSDFTITIIAPDDYKRNMQAKCKILKNRFANKLGFSDFIIGLNDELQTFFDIPDDQIDKGLKDALEVTNSKGGHEDRSSLTVPGDSSEYKTSFTSGISKGVPKPSATQQIIFGSATTAE